jgi:hypothetical protein
VRPARRGNVGDHPIPPHGAGRTVCAVDEPSEGSRDECWVAERFWPGVTERDARLACAALRVGCERLTDDARVRVVASTYFPDDETVVVRFEGTRSAVVAVHELARCRYDRLTRAVDVDPGPCG